MSWVAQFTPNYVLMQTKGYYVAIINYSYLFLSGWRLLISGMEVYVNVMPGYLPDVKQLVYIIVVMILYSG